MKFNKIIIWGHKLHSHTHSYIHYCFYKAFKYLGYETLWLDNNDNIDHINFNNSLFITEGQVDGQIPLYKDCYYLLHNCYDEKYHTMSNKCNLQVYTDDVLKYNLNKLEDFVYADYHGKCLYMPWATDLLPDEIERNKPAIPFNKNSKVINWVGSLGYGIFGNIPQINPFIETAKKNGINFQHWASVSFDQNIELIRNSYMGVTIVGQWQHEKNYIPCRIFKNISYGQFGITNSRASNDILQGKIVYNDNTEQLFYDAKNRLEKLSLHELHSLMDFVKNKHTYLNRVENILSFIERVR